MRELRIKAVPHNMAVVMCFVEKFCQENEEIKNKVNRCLLICDEIFSNIIKYGETKESLVTVSLEYMDNEHIRIMFADNGIPFNPLSVQSLDSNKIKSRTKGGLGIHLVKELAQSVVYEYRNGQNVLDIKMKL